MSNLISCYDLETKELKYFKVPESVVRRTYRRTKTFYGEVQ